MTIQPQCKKKPVRKTAIIVGLVGKNHKTKDTSVKQVAIIPTQRIREGNCLSCLSKVYTQIDCKIRKKEKPNINNNVITIFICKEKVTFERKKKDKRLKARDTVRAEDKSAIVRIEETTKMFILKSKEYNPTAYKEVIKILVRKRAGIKK